MDTKKIKLYQLGYKQSIFVKECSSEEELDSFISKAANELNYGLLRTWTENGKKYYDCGPIVYYIILNED